jgi:integrase
MQNSKDITLKRVTDGLRAYYKAMGRRGVKKLLDNVDKLFGDAFRADTLTAVQLADYRTHRLKEGIHPPTLAHEMRSLKTALRLALREGKIRRMPVIQIDADTNRNDEGEFTREQFTALLTELPPYLKPLVWFLFCAGMRVMEPVGPAWSEVNLEQGELRISGRRTKNGQQKVLYLSGEPLRVLLEQPNAGGRIFVDEWGEPLRYDAILEVFQQACKRAKIVEGFTDADGGVRLPGFHDLRRTFACMANRAGVTHRAIVEIAGWKSEAMLLIYLSDAKPSEQRAAFARLELST